MANEVVGIEIKAELAAFRAELAKIPDIGAKEARSLTSQLSREIRKAESASKRAAEQSKKTAAALRTQAAATKEVAAATKETTTTLKTIGAAVVSIELLKQAFEFAKQAIAGTLERAQRLDEELGGDLKASVTEASQALSDMKDAAVQPLIPSIQSLANGIADIAGGARLAMEAIFGLTNAQAELQAQTALENEAIEKQDQRVMDAETAVRNLTERLQKYKETGEATTDGIRTYEQAIADASDELERQRGILVRLDGEFDVDREKRQQAARERLKQAQDAGRAAESSTQRITQAQQREEAGIVSVLEARKKAYIEAANARQRQADEDIASAERVKEARLAAIDEERLARELAAERERDLRSSLAATAIDTAVAVSQSIVDGLQSVALANVKEARRRAEIELGLAILRGELQAAGAFGTTLATYGGTPQGFALAAAAAAAVGIQSKGAAAAGFAQASEQFHSGGVFRARDEGVATLRNGEGILTPSAVRRIGGEQSVRALNASTPAPAEGMTVVFDGRLYDATISDSLNRRGSPLTRRLSALTRKTGTHRPHA